MFSIGEFSKITGLTIKTLRFYHEQGLLTPTTVDEETGYRYYAEAKIETARVIKQLRGLEFTVADISQIVSEYEDEGDILTYIEEQKATVEKKLQKYQSVAASLEQIIEQERTVQEAMKNATFTIEEKTLEPMLIAGMRMTGKYAECGKGFARIGKSFGRFICGKAMLLHFDCEYKEKDANFEACMPIRRGESTGDIDVRELPGGKCVSLMHQGPYDELGNSYGKLLAYAKEKGFAIETPSREVYIKGPGMIFKGNPKKYLTEVQLLLKEQ